MCCVDLADFRASCALGRKQRLAFRLWCVCVCERERERERENESWLAKKKFRPSNLGSGTHPSCTRQEGGRFSRVTRMCCSLLLETRPAAEGDCRNGGDYGALCVPDASRSAEGGLCASWTRALQSIPRQSWLGPWRSDCGGRVERELLRLTDAHSAGRDPMAALFPRSRSASLVFLGKRSRPLSSESMSQSSLVQPRGPPSFTYRAVDKYPQRVAGGAACCTCTSTGR
jgi:hypothetical protein